MSSPDGAGPAAPFSPSRARRLILFGLILALHAGFFILLKNGLLQRVVTASPSNVVMAVIFPPEMPAKPVPIAPPAPPSQPPPARAVPKPKPPVRKPTPPSRPAPAALPAPARTDNPAPAMPTPPAAAPEAESAPPSPPQPAPAAAPPATPKTITSAAQYLQPPQPEYPPQSKRIGEEGRVVLRVLIDERGAVGQVSIQTSSGFPRLDAAAEEAVRQARFKPHVEDGRSLAVYVMVPISFRLDQ